MLIGQRRGRGPRAKKPPKLRHRVVETGHDLGESEEFGTAGHPGVWNCWPSRCLGEDVGAEARNAGWHQGSRWRLSEGFGRNPPN